MADQWPKITSRKIIKISQWMDVMAREVEFAPGEAPQVYHAVSQLDYLAIVDPVTFVPVSLVALALLPLRISGTISPSLKQCMARRRILQEKI